MGTPTLASPELICPIYRQRPKARSLTLCPLFTTRRLINIILGFVDLVNSVTLHDTNEFPSKTTGFLLHSSVQLNSFQALKCF
jgi:hypothetical protein